MTGPRELLAMTRTLLRAARMPKLASATHDSIGHRLLAAARRAPAKTALIDATEMLTWDGLNARANRFAAVLAARGIGKGDCVALLMENRLDFLAALLGILKAGAVAGLMNTNQRGQVLSHSLGLIEPKALILGAELAGVVSDANTALPLADDAVLWLTDPAATEPQACPDGFTALAPLLDAASAAEPAAMAAITLGDPALYIFTSGTTGLPKAAVLTHERFLRGMYGYGRVCLNVQHDDRLYNCLPLYHSTGLVIGFGSVLLEAASMFVRRRFSASNFLKEVREHRTNCFVYVGELCRYLLNQPKRHDDAENPLEKVIGNGLRPDIWLDFKQRFAIDGVYEIYGASEGNTGFVNAFNKDCTIGFGVSAHVLVQCDTETAEVLRGPDGLCLKTARGEPGLLLNEISDTTPFEGYTNTEATEKKIVRNVLKQGDAYFNTGDLVRAVDVGFAFGQQHYQFVDRLGDTFRWRGENCSTNEVGEVLNGFAQVQTANVYGVEVPGAEGKAGMAAVQFDPSIGGPEAVDWEGLAAHVDAHLAPYARPLFIRVLHDLDTTATFKLKKTDLREAGYDPERVGNDALYVRAPGGGFVPLDEAFLERIREGQAGF
jgi:citronellyl-CoA synthetase